MQCVGRHRQIPRWLVGDSLQKGCGVSLVSARKENCFAARGLNATIAMPLGMAYEYEPRAVLISCHTFHDSGLCLLLALSGLNNGGRECLLLSRSRHVFGLGGASLHYLPHIIVSRPTSRGQLLYELQARKNAIWSGQAARTSQAQPCQSIAEGLLYRSIGSIDADFF